MSLRLTRSPLDDLPEILRPQVNTPALAETAYIQRELGDDGFRVMFNHDRQKFVVMDTRAPGGPASSYVMVVQFDGEHTRVDERTVKALRKMLGQSHRDTAQELIDAELERERNNKSRRESMSSAFASDFRFFGQQVTPSVGWRDRTDPAARDRIRQEAGLE